jgi:hypothetical protein
VAKLQKLYLLPQAVDDFQEIEEPLRSQVIGRLRAMRKFPRLGQKLGGPLRGWRATPVGMFRIYYRIMERGVEVGFIRHCKRRSPIPSKL